LFYVSAALAIVGGFIMLFTWNTIHSAMGLLLTFLATAGIYLSLSSPFLAVAQIFLYSGAVAVLIVFAIMLIDENKKYELPVQGLFLKSLAALSVIYTSYLLIRIFGFSKVSHLFLSDTHSLGRVMVNDYVLHIEALSIVLLISIMAAILIAKRRV
ncbi:MAG: NADH-quinone oxidoreductase subunit J family protein, partial [Myxococcota bacterium]